jgi:hypothetical protein
MIETNSGAQMENVMDTFLQKENAVSSIPLNKAKLRHSSAASTQLGMYHNSTNYKHARWA